MTFRASSVIRCLACGYPKDSIACIGFELEIRLLRAQGSVALRGKRSGEDKEIKELLSSLH